MPIELIHLSKAFNGRPVLSDVNYRFEEGSFTGITGPSGCGKTTLFRILLGLTPADSGAIRGFDPVRAAAVFQEDRLIETLTPTANLRAVLPGKPARSRLEEMLDGIGLSDCLHQPVQTLSGGQKRRVALLRALLTDADILLMDEPLKGLDEETRRRTIEFIRPMLLGRTVLWISHDPQEILAFSGNTFALPQS